MDSSAPPESRPDLALLVYDLRGSGVVRNVRRIAEATARGGIATEVWVVSGEGALAGALPQGVRLRVLGSPTESLGRTLGSIGAVAAIARAIREVAPRILFSAGNQIHMFVAAAWNRAGRPARTRFLGRASNAVVGHSGGWRSVARAVERYQYAPMERIVAVAQELGDDLTRHLGIPGERIVAIPNGVDLPDLATLGPVPHPWLEPGQPPLVIGMGRLVRQKNFPLLIEAFAKVRREMPARLAILGEGPPKARRELEQLAARLGVADDLLLPGFVSNPTDWLARSPLFVLSSLWEGSSNALLEALACGAAIVATDIPSGARSVLAGGHGVLVPLDDPDAMAKAMRDLLVHPPTREAQRQRAEKFSSAAAMAAYVALLREELARA